MASPFELAKMLVTRPKELRTLAQYWLWYEKKRDITAMQEHATSGWDRATMRRCWEFLDMTSRSFSPVIKELDGELARVICLFYLVLRGLDTIEDDTSIPDEKKQPLLRNFHEYCVTEGWTFDGNRIEEKDRQLLVEFDKVVTEIRSLEPKYKDVILDLCQKMETGMADFCAKAASGNSTVDTIEEHDLYCHYVAGCVGEGLSRIFSVSGKEVEWLGGQLELSNSMGSLLQKTNITRDFREDVDTNRCFWPREIWGRYGFTKMSDMHAPGREKEAMWALSEMIADALRHTTDALDYLALLHNQSIFNFCAIPVTMAIATLERCFMNPLVFKANVKIRKAEAVDLIMSSTNPRDVAYIFQKYARLIHAKAVPTDPSYLRIAIACGRIERWCEHRYPSFVKLVSSGGKTAQTIDPSTSTGALALKDMERDREKARIAAGGRPNPPTQQQEDRLPIEFYLGFGGFALFMGLLMWGSMKLLIYFFDEEPL